MAILVQHRALFKTWIVLGIFNLVKKEFESRDIPIGIATSYGLDGLGSLPAEARYFCLFRSVQTESRVHPVDTGGSLPRVKQPRCEADHSPLSRIEVKNGGAIPPLLARLLLVVHN
jgi:hypothetical protein